MLRSSGHGKPRESRRMNYREEHFADDGDDDDDDDDDVVGGDDTDSPYFEPTDLSDNDFCDCIRSTAVNAEATPRDRRARKASRRPSQVPCAVEADSLPLARPIPLQYDSDLYDTWCTKDRKLKRHLGGEKYQENRDDAAVRTGDSKFKASASTAPPPPETVARRIHDALTRQAGVGVGVAAPTATTPRFYRRLTREASRRPSRLCLSGASRRDPEVVARRQSMHGSRSQPVTTAAPALLKLSSDVRAAARHSAIGKAATQMGEVKIPVQAHVSYVPHTDDSPRSGAAAHADRHRPRGEIRIPLDVFASPFLACSPDREHWPHPLKKVSSHRVRRSLPKVQQMRSHVTAHPVLVEAQVLSHPSDRLRKRNSLLGGAKLRAASDKPAQKHRTPSVRSRASETLMPHVVQSNLDALLPPYEAQLAQPSAQRRSSCATTAALAPTRAPGPWGNRVDPRLLPPHMLIPRKPASVRQREFIARLERQLREVAQPRATNAQRPATSPSSSNVAQPPAQPPAQPLPAAQAAPTAQAAPPAPAAPAAPAAHPVSSAESKLSSLLDDLMKSGFDVSHLERYATGAATATPTPTAKAEGTATATATAPQSSKVCKPDPRGYYEAVYNQQSLARVDFAPDVNASKAAMPADLTRSPDKSVGRQNDGVDAAKSLSDGRSGHELRRPRSKTTSECAYYVSQDEESVFENQDFWDTLDHNVDMNSVQSLSDGLEGQEERFKYFRNGQIPETVRRSSSHTALRPNLGESKSGQRRANHGSLHELWRHSDRRPARAHSDKPVAESKDQPSLVGDYSKDGYYHWSEAQKKSDSDGPPLERSRGEIIDCNEPRTASTAAATRTPTTSHGGGGGGGGGATVDADDARCVQLSREQIIAVVEETLERREKSCRRVRSQTKMDIGQAIELIKEMSSTMNDSLCMEIVKALSDRLIDCETAKSEQEYVTQLKKLRSDHLRHITRDVKRLQDLEGLVQSACSKICSEDCL